MSSMPRVIRYKSATEILDNADLSDENYLENTIIKIQSSIYPTELVEPLEIFKHILNISPDFCWFATDINADINADLYEKKGGGGGDVQ